MADMYLVFDVEATGVPLDWNAPVADVDNWPRIVQLAWGLYGADGVTVSKRDYIIRPDGFSIPEESVEIHGISTERAMSEGVELKGVLQEFVQDVAGAKCLVAHNVSFDESVVGAELIRAGIDACCKMFHMPRVCTMVSSIEFCQMQGLYGILNYKFPKLEELYFKLFQDVFSSGHDARVDVRICAACFFELKRLGIIYCGV